GGYRRRRQSGQRDVDAVQFVARRSARPGVNPGPQLLVARSGVDDELLPFGGNGSAFGRIAVQLKAVAIGGTDEVDREVDGRFDTGERGAAIFQEIVDVAHQSAG